MKAIMVMFDSLNKKYLSAYGNEKVITPNFTRLANKAVTFDKFFAGSLPCMPARREIHTGRLNFLHRSWGPLEPFDDSMPEILKNKGIYTHLISDHFHYWEDGGATYHPRYSSHEFVRGQDGDLYKALVNTPKLPKTHSNNRSGPSFTHDMINRMYIDSEEKMPQAKCFNLGLEFIEANHDADNWFLQLETFDPHEPFFTQEKYKELYKHKYEGDHYDWPVYNTTNDDDEESINHVQNEYKALVTMCDNYLGTILDMMDKHNMWEDTMLIVNTDHGFLLGEHEFWGKNIQPFYNEIVNTPFFIYDPRTESSGERRDALAQTIDIAPTLLDFFNVDIPKDMEGKALKETVEKNVKVRDHLLFGMAGGHVNITDGKHVYMRAPKSYLNLPKYEYTLMPTKMNSRFTPNEMQNLELQEPFSFTKGVKTLKIPTSFAINPYWYGDLLFDLEKDPEQNSPFRDYKVESNLVNEMVSLMKANDAPEEQYERLGILKDEINSPEYLEKIQAEKEASEYSALGDEFKFEKNADKFLLMVLSLVPQAHHAHIMGGLKQALAAQNTDTVTMQTLEHLFMQVFPEPMGSMLLKFTKAMVTI